MCVVAMEEREIQKCLQWPKCAYYSTENHTPLCNLPYNPLITNTNICRVYKPSQITLGIVQPKMKVHVIVSHVCCLKLSISLSAMILHPLWLAISIHRSSVIILTLSSGFLSPTGFVFSGMWIFFTHLHLHLHLII